MVEHWDMHLDDQMVDLLVDMMALKSADLMAAMRVDTKGLMSAGK